jgi:hypothetical protein
MQFFVGFHGVDIITIEQEVYRLACQANQLSIAVGPCEFLFGQALVIQHKAVRFPKQTFDFSVGTVDKNIQAATEGIVTQLKFNNGADTAIALSKIDGVTI